MKEGLQDYGDELGCQSKAAEERVEGDFGL